MSATARSIAARSGNAGGRRWVSDVQPNRRGAGIRYGSGVTGFTSSAGGGRLGPKSIVGSALGLLVALTFTATVMGCEPKREERAPILRGRAEPYFREFERFDAWARRSFDADLALRDPRALAETLFAPIRREREVVAAWVERDGPDARTLGLRTEEALSGDGDWVAIRGVPMLDRLEVMERTVPDKREWRAPDVNAILLSRRVASARGGAPVRVTVAYDPAVAP